MMVNPVVHWPDGVPSCIMPLSPQGGVRDNRLSFETDSRMPPIERSAGSWAPEVYSVEMVPMSIPQFELFQHWFRHTAKYGVLPFVWMHPITKTLGVWKIQKSDPPYQVSKSRTIPAGSGRRGISVSFTVMSYPADAPPEYLVQESTGLILQEESSKIILKEGRVFGG